PVVKGLRLNTVMPIKDSLEDVLKRLQDVAGEKELWVDLKYRQLRIKTYGVPPFTEIELTHEISVDTPTTAYFSDGTESATVLAVHNKRLIMQEGPQRVVGPGESINIPDGNLIVHGGFTDLDEKYIVAARAVGVHRYMLSFVEEHADIEALLKLDPDADILAKIESRKGLHYVRLEYAKDHQLMAARGDLYHEIKRPHHILQALELIIEKDPQAVAASRIFPSLAYSLEPSCPDIGDADNLLRMGYRTFMFGDDICMRRESVISGLNLFEAIAERAK
ncbi:MAG TPA: pyruvate kinase, partial [Candidatus Nanoarchaeia archaeon]|nr:pyruvate kinase [Candidatus Nanoarchaeia archaeon]